MEGALNYFEPETSSVSGRQAVSTEQRTNLKFLVQLGKTPSEALVLLQQVYRNETMSRSRVFEWCKRFREGREDVEDDPRSGRPSTSRTEANVERVRQTVRGDRRATVRWIASELGMNRDNVWKIITEDLTLQKVCSKLVPKRLSEDQKDYRIHFCQDLLERLETEPDLLSRVITGDESWISEYDPQTKRQSPQAKNPMPPSPKKARESKYNVKVLLIVFFDMRGIVYWKFLPQGQTLNQHVYKEILLRLISSVREKRPELWRDKSWLLHHDSAPAHTALSVRQFLAEKSVAVLEQPQCSPDLAPWDFFLFPKLKGAIRGNCFEDADDMKVAVTMALRRLPEKAFHECMNAWERRLGKCVGLRWEYVEDENL
nr:protein GVQW3-like [Nerophis lumbriciformis]